jgi:hypothetical protein
MSILFVGDRSTLYEAQNGELYRRYHDTNELSQTFSGHVDSSGVRRCFGNRRVDTLRENTFRGAQGNGRIQPHLHNTLSIVCRNPPDIQFVAHHLDVAINTAWSYVCRTVETWPTSWYLACSLVDDDLLAAVQNEHDLTGSLRDLMRRLPPMAHHALREMDDRYAHLRLARLCVEAQRRQSQNSTTK